MADMAEATSRTKIGGFEATRSSLILGRRADRLKRVGSLAGHGVLLLITSTSVFAVLFIFFFIVKEALPFFQLRGITELLTHSGWYPSREPAEFGALPLFVGSGLVTAGAIIVAVPLGILAAVCLSDVLPFGMRQVAKPVIEILTAIPSVVFGFFALVVFAPFLQERGGGALAIGFCFIALPLVLLGGFVASDIGGTFLSRLVCTIARLLTSRGSDSRKQETHKRLSPDTFYLPLRVVVFVLFGLTGSLVVLLIAGRLSDLEISSGVNAFNVSIILGIMALPTIVSVSEDALQALGRDLREASYALGATRTETITRVLIPAAKSGIAAAVILGIMRAVGETMVVWMASGNAAQIPSPWYNFLEPVRTLTATIAGDMGEADHVTGSARYHVLFALAASLLLISFLCDLVSEWLVRRSRVKKG